MPETSIVRQNLMDDIKYRPYCGNTWSSCYIDRTIRLDNGQFQCPNCKWVSEFPADFIERYKTKHGL